MTSLGYARVSTLSQTLDQQEDALKAAGVERIYSDRMSGTRDDRPGLLALLDYARAGDTVTVVALDRLGRSLTGIIRTVDDLQSRGIVLRSLREGVDYSTAVGKMVAAIFGALAEYERTLILERASAARDAAKKRGKPLGPARKFTDRQAATALQMRRDGRSIAEIMGMLKVSRATVYRVFDQAEQAEALQEASRA
ncbi:recombinase family protein [Jatrophihabitans telluris]|uniref:Recombinase family protein n=1 Tax=Jatrophihabitans telluris TaxID=2038343 RepID=A0ABY4R1N7_9ACTN|nr:recombinase family protein [Jatrophihabitans telluris]UQX89196.1 recombinase family protein [Jatrophihabitans telluris]